MMARVEDAHKAIHGLENVEVDGRQIKVEKAKRRGAYEKTPGQCTTTFFYLIFIYHATSLSVLCF